MARLSATAIRYALFRDLNIVLTDIKSLPHCTVSLYMQGKGGNKKKDMMKKRKIYTYYKMKSQNPVSFEMFWGIEKEYFEII